MTTLYHRRHLAIAQIGIRGYAFIGSGLLEKGAGVAKKIIFLLVSVYGAGTFIYIFCLALGAYARAGAIENPGLREIAHNIAVIEFGLSGVAMLATIAWLLVFWPFGKKSANDKGSSG